MLDGRVFYQGSRVLVYCCAVHAEGSTAECGQIHHRCSIGCWRADVGQNQWEIPDERGWNDGEGIGVVIGKACHEVR